MKKTLYWALLLAALLTLLTGAALAEPWAGSGTEADPWKITSAADLVALREYLADPNNGTSGIYFKQTADINLSEYCGPSKGSWAPLITNALYFDATYDGAGHTISGLYINNTSNHQSLFGECWEGSSGTVKNLNVAGSVSGGEQVGGVFGTTGCNLENCSFTGTVSGAVDVGGIVGYTKGSLDNCSFSGTVTGDKGVGGIAGICYKATIKNCTCQSGTVTGSDQVGGIVGLGNAQLIENCKSYGTVKASTHRAGGIAGETCGPIKNCENHGPVSAPNYAGGITGHTFSGLGYQGIVENCKNYGDITIDNEYVGGIVGWAEKPINNCENHGKIKGREFVGGIVGDTTSTISQCKSDGQVVGEAHTGSVVGYGTHGAVVTLKPNGGTGSETSDMLYSAPACPFTNGSYAFFAWNTAADGSGTYYFENDELPNDNEMTFYAIWMRRRTVAYRTLEGGWWNERMFQLRDGIAALPAGWYVVGENTTLSQRLMLSGEVNLVLWDGTTLNASKGINVPEGCSLTIWAQGQTALGTLNATGAADCAGIGGGKGQSGGTITINGGVMNATGGNYGAGIGGGDTGTGGTVIVNRGTVTARGKEGAAGIGGGDYGRGGTYTINGGSVTAIGSKRSSTGQASPGIGAGRPKADGSSPLSGGKMNFYGGTTVARSGGTDAGIGAYAVGLNYADFTAAAEQYGNFGHGLTPNFGTGMAATPAGAAEPALFHQRRLALMSGAVTIAPCRHPGQGATSQCAYCQGDTRFDTYLYHAASGYLIQTPEDWDTFAWLVNEAKLPTAGLTFRLEANISVSAMVGTSANPFSGIFNGNGKTLTVNLTASSAGKGPFAFASGASFAHLRVAGTITTSVHDTGGLVGQATGDCAITDCVSDVHIVANGGNGHAGFVGSLSGSVAITGSVFTGSIVGANTSYCAGFAGAGGGTVDDCVYDGLISGIDNNNTFLRQKNRAENCYYTNLNGIDRIKGRQALSVAAGEGVTLGFGEPKTDGVYPTSGITAYDTGLLYNGVFYAGPEQTVPLTLSTDVPEGSLLLKYDASAGTLTRNGDTWTLTLPAEAVVISAVYIPAFGTPDFTLPAFLTTVEEEAFEGIAASVVDIPESCVSIGAHAFRNCPNLTQIRIPDGCTLGTDVFDSCEMVYVYGTAGSSAEAYCSTHANCEFVPLE